MPPSLAPTGFVSTKEAAKGSGYSADYLSRLARAGHVQGVLVGRAWFVEPTSLATYLEDQKLKKQERLDALSRARVLEYQAHQEPQEAPVMVASAPVRETAAPPLRDPITIFEEVRVVEVTPEPVLSPLSPFLRRAGPAVPILSFMTACAVVTAGVVIGSTPLIPGAGAQIMAMAQTASGGFAIMTAPMRAHIAAELVRPVMRVASTPRPVLGELALFTRPPLLIVASSSPAKTAVLTNNQAVKSYLDNLKSANAPSLVSGQHVLTHGAANIAEAVWGVANAYVGGIHALIALEARVAYAVPPVSNSISRVAVGTIGEVGSVAKAYTGKSSTALHATALLGGRGALALVDEAYAPLLGVSAPLSTATTPTPASRITLPLPRLAAGITQSERLVALMYGGVGSDAGRIIHVPLHVVSGTKNIAQNIVSSAQSYGNKLFARAPAKTQLAATDASTGTAGASPSATEAVASPGPQTLPVVVSVPVTGQSVSYGDLIAYNASTKAYTVAQGANQTVVGVAVEHPPVLLDTSQGGVPVMKSGRALVNVADENGSIAPGDEISLSRDIPGKAMKASAGSAGVVGIAREPFSGQQGTSTSITVEGKKVAVGTIAVDIAGLAGEGVGEGTGAALARASCTSGSFWCNLESKVVSASLLSLLRYLLAMLVAVGALYIAFRTFLTDAVSGVISVGRNPRAKTAIQAMVIFNGVLALGIAAAGLIAAVVILFIQL